MPENKLQHKTSLIVEKGNGEWWGRVKVRGSLIVCTAKNLENIKNQLKAFTLEFENVTIEDFELSFDLTSFFEQYSYLNISDIAKRTGINPGLMRQYASGLKFPSKERVKEIEKAIREIGRELTKVKLHKAQKGNIASNEKNK